MNELRAGSTPASRELARHCITDEHFDLRETLRKFGGADVLPTLEEMKRSLRPLRDVEPKLNGSVCERISKPLRMIGMKVQPTMSAEQCGAWLGAMIAGLSDLPIHIIERSAHEALHHPFRYIAEVDGHLRSIAEQHLNRHRRAIARLDAMRAEIINAASPPQPLLEEQPVEPVDESELRSIMKSPMSRSLIKMGLTLGTIDPDMLERLRSESPDTPEGGEGT